jgi:hypothetical protein
MSWNIKMDNLIEHKFWLVLSSVGVSGPWNGALVVLHVNVGSSTCSISIAYSEA